MTKRLAITRSVQAHAHIEALRASASATLDSLNKNLSHPDPLSALGRLKFEAIGHDPLDSTRKLNLIEQLNQTFTYLAAFRGAEFLFNRHPNVNEPILNLGNVSGWDIETQEDNGIAAEVFAAVTPNNNQKLRNDIKKVQSAPHRNRYVLFICPRHAPGRISHKLAQDDVQVWSLGPIQ